jgi:hypothetical protein
MLTTPSVASLPSGHILVPSLGRFDEITYLVEKASGLARLIEGDQNLMSRHYTTPHPTRAIGPNEH